MTDDYISSMSLGVVLVTAASETQAKAIATALLESRLAACVSITPIHSMYLWQGQINSDSEWQLIIKTDLAKFSALASLILELHSYEIPEIIALPIVTGSQPYLKWLAENVGN